MTHETDDHLLSPAEEKAVEWHVRLASEEASEADWLAFEAWLDESAANIAAYRKVEAVWSEFDPSPLPAAAPAAPRVARSPRPRRRMTWAPAAIAAGLVVAVGLGVAVVQLRAPAAEVYQTAKGERRDIALADGSKVRLNSGSRIVVALTRGERRVEMAEAEVAFDVAKDPARPFVIDAGDRRIRVVGTEFDVLRYDGLVSVAVRRGVVEVRRAGEGPDASPIARLVRGQSLEHREGEAGDRVVSADPDKAFAWTQGRLIYDDARLEDVVRDLNRYGQTPIVVAPAARNLRLTAVLDVDREEAMLRRLSGFLPVRVTPEGAAYRLDLRPAQP